MNTDQLTAIGLQPLQAKAYAALLDTGSLTPPRAATLLGITRTNAYKLLDKLVELGLANKCEVGKKFAYFPGNPMALTSLIASERYELNAREQAIGVAMNGLLSQYYQYTDRPDVQLAIGKDAVVEAYNSQLALRQEVYFIRSRADVPVLGFDTMHSIRKTPFRNGIERFGIVPDLQHGKPAPAKGGPEKWHKTWVREEDYTAPVEWSLSGSTLLIVVFGDEPHAITITDPLVCTAFLQLFKLLDTCLRALPGYADLPRSVSA
jgi:hypothetical protein